MHTKIIILCSILLISGCSPEINKYQLVIAEEVCVTGIDYLWVRIGVTPMVRCLDGTKHVLKRNRK